LPGWAPRRSVSVPPTCEKFFTGNASQIDATEKHKKKNIVLAWTAFENINPSWLRRGVSLDARKREADSPQVNIYEMYTENLVVRLT
jgi:hypothetical protein